MELFLPGEYTEKWVNLFVGGVEHLSKEVHEAAGFTLLVVSPIPLALGTPIALLADSYKTIERDFKDLLEIGPSGRYLSKKEVNELNSIIKKITNKTDDLLNNVEKLTQE